jgi:hypothetical protein
MQTAKLCLAVLVVGKAFQPANQKEFLAVAIMVKCGTLCGCSLEWVEPGECVLDAAEQ